ncbi:MAG: hypothetical protein P8X42_18825, partial [Calditrichaceae bacterium]
MTDEKTFIPSVKNILKDHIFDIPAIFILGNGFYILSEISWSFLIFNVYLLGIALIFPLLSILKFYITGSKTITIKNDGMIIHISDSQKVNYKWTDFDQIWLSDSGWIFEKSDRRKVKILKTGFDTKDWHKMANMIYEYKNATFEEKELNRTKPEFILFKPIYQKPLLISFIIMPVAGVFIVINILT